jgi:hypothetical protein
MRLDDPLLARRESASGERLRERNETFAATRLR